MPRWRYLLLLLALLGLLVIQPMLPEDASGRPIVPVDAALGAVLLAGLWSVGHNRRALLAGGALVLVSVAATALMHWRPRPWLAWLGLGSGLVFLVSATTAILFDVLRKRSVRTDTILGAICVYLLIGMVWMVIYSMIERASPGSFALASGMGAAGDEDAVIASHFLDYSIFTLTTIGPQAVSASSRVARAWTGLEAITGQLFLAVLIARLVGQHASRRSG